MFPKLIDRCREPELMDQPGLDDFEHHRALTGLARINRWSASASILWPRIRELSLERLRSGRREPLRVLDIATGAGDVPIRLRQKALHAKLPIEFAGCDMSPLAISHAEREASARGVDLKFFALDLFRDEIPTGYDIVTCSLFLHHLEEAVAIELLRKARSAAGELVLLNDLIRSRTGYALAYVGTRLLSRSPIVHVDGPLSVQGAFTMAEALELSRKAGWQKPQIHWRWPYRFLLSESRM